MPLFMCTKFQINRIILTLFSGVWDKYPIPVAEKVVNAVGNRVSYGVPNSQSHHSHSVKDAGCGPMTFVQKLS